MKTILKITAVLLTPGILVAILIFAPRPLPSELKETALNTQVEHASSIHKKDKIIIVDYDKSVLARRLWLYDVSRDIVLMNLHVGHAYKSGFWKVKKTSNVSGSNLSSVGAFVTQEDYHGNYGYSMRINGLESINNNTRSRFMVFHPSVAIRLYKIRIPMLLGYFSMGCFPVYAPSLTELIKQSKKGTLLYVHKTNS